MRVFGRNASLLTALGGAAFAASISYCGWTYLVTWRVPHRASFSFANLGADALLFTVFAFHHSIAARKSVKSWIAAVVGATSVRTVFVWIASLLLTVVCAAWRPVGGVVYAQSGAPAVAFFAVQLIGFAFAFEAVRAIDPLELAGFEPTAPTVIQANGPYKWVRHPLYTGWMLIAFGAATMTADRLVFAIVSSTYLVIAIPWEEASLHRTFGQTYVAYVSRVRCRVIPFIY